MINDESVFRINDESVFQFSLSTMKVISLGEKNGD